MIEQLLSFFRRTINRPTVDDVLSSFQRIVTSLDAVSTREAERASSLFEESNRLSREANDASRESGRAKSVASKVRALLS